MTAQIDPRWVQVKHPLYGIWGSIKQQCMNPKNRAFKYYGARGIRFCEEWKSFSTFVDDVGERPSPHHQLCRMNTEGNFEPGNVAWVDKNRSRHPLHDTWQNMWQRCENPNSESFKTHGGRGIKVCPRWESFWLFVEDVGPRPSAKHKLIRVDRNRDFEPGNLQWTSVDKQRRHPLYPTWRSMWRRCTVPECSSFRWYGARGITVCPRWESFAAFLEDMGERPSGRTLDRLNNDGNYEPSNCRWATIKQQNANKRKTPGSKNGMAKLTEASVQEIRRQLKVGDKMQQELAWRYGVSDALVSKIERRLLWRHVA